MGATSVQMIGDEVLGKIYERNGYDYVESTYHLKIDKEIKQFDDFAADAEAVREAVIVKDFTNQEGPDGGKYTGILQHAVPGWHDRIAELIKKPIIPRLSFFRLNLEGELPHSWVHSDDICSQYASVLYMNAPDQCFGGTAFWRHKNLGVERLPARETLADADAFYTQMTADWKNLDLWKRTDFIQMKFNRFVTYPTSLFHSRYPFEGFGSGPKDGRLIWVCFYDLETIQ